MSDTSHYDRVYENQVSKELCEQKYFALKNIIDQNYSSLKIILDLKIKIVKNFINSIENSIALAKKDMEKRLDGMNEFRDAQRSVRKIYYKD